MDNLTVSLSKSPLNKDITLLTVKGSLDTNTISEFDKNFQSALRDNQYKLVIDLKDANYISSAGWGVFVSEIKRIRHGNGDLVLAGMSPDVLDVFDLLQFGTILKFFPDAESAVKKGFEGLPSGAGKATAKNSRNRANKINEKVAPLELTGEPSQMKNRENEPNSALEPETHEVRDPYWRRALLDWRLWALLVVGLVAIGIVVTRN